ncbi:uncharacterized protein LOC116193738 [Punica granatum]|uniref:Uncharacterized protein LOC116193738 n=1 Tax=Punica granatum TaxID=22663 RepID=A0A6P8CB65_PUNGR|nr:uncharacterized protein LOC116193738 [Punica granatum]
MIAKSREGEDHLVNLKRLFDRLKKYKLRLNPAKCTFGSKLGKLLGFIVSEHGIEVDPDKVKAILEMPPPKTVREVRGFLGRLNYIARFIANLTDKCQPLFRLLRKNAAIEWDDECQKAFDTIKAYLIQPPVLVPPISGRPLILYLTADPLKYLLDSPSSMRSIAKWRCQLAEYDIEYVARTSVKGQAIADHLAEFPIEDNTPIDPDFPDEGILQVDSEEDSPAWKMYFNGAVNSTGSGIACILGLQAAIDFKVKKLEVFGDSMLTIFQTLGQWKTKDEKLVPYHEYLEELAENFEKITFTYTPRIKNHFADALATLASMVSITKENLIEPLEIEITKGPAHCDAIEATDAKPWFEDIKHFLQTGQYPQFASHRDRKTLRLLATHYFLSGETLYRRSLDATLLRCVDGQEAQRLIQEVHGGSCGPHMNGLMLAKKIMRLGYFWSTMETDCVKHVRHCCLCQVYADQIKAPPNELHPMAAPWPFSMWGMDVIGPINPKASNGHLFILVAIDYFTKWIEAITLASVTAKAVARFLKRDIIARYGVPATLNLIDEKRLATLCHGQCYQQRMARAFNAKVRHREFKPGDLVLRKVWHIAPDSRGKFAYKYDGPFVVTEVFSKGAIILSDMDGTENALPVNADALRKYYP